MAKSLVGKVNNSNFAFFWLLIGGGLGNIGLMPFSIVLWPILLPSTVLSILIAIKFADSVRRPKIWLAADLVLTCALLGIFAQYFGGAGANVAFLLPEALILVGCILGIMNW